jgi:hypothetical protein
VDLDPIERALAQDVHLMDEHDLLVYCQESAKLVQGRPLPIDGRREVGQLRWLRRVYGPDAGRMLKKIFHDHHGKIDGRPFTFSMLARTNRAKLDDIYAELHQSDDFERFT